MKISEKYIKSFLILTAFLLFYSNSNLIASDSFSPACQEAMRAILDLRPLDADSVLNEERIKNPGNPYIVYLEHYSEAIQLIITENPELYERFINQFEARLNKVDKLADDSPEKDWLISEMLFHAGLAQVKFGSRISGVNKILLSNRKINHNRQEYPDFLQNQKLTGIYNILFDQIPPFMKWAADMFGFSGNTEMGLYQLTQYYEHFAVSPGLAEEAALILALGYKLSDRTGEGFRFIREQTASIQNSNLVKYVCALSATYNYENEPALNMLGQIDRQKIQVTFHSLDYLTGRCKLNHLEPDAHVSLERYLNDYPGLDFKKDVCNRLSYFYLLQNDTVRYRNYKAMVSEVGQELRDRDQEAVIESEHRLIPDIRLLKARLLCDGGYLDEALGQMDAIDIKNLGNEAYIIEYHYRMGRILQLKQHNEQAIRELTRAYQDGKSLPLTFATRSAYFLGNLYENLGNYPVAREWYEKCLAVYSPDHTAPGVEDSAEKAIRRLR